MRKSLPPLVCVAMLSLPAFLFAAPLLAQAPVVFVRGNHEDCRRGGDGWARLLDASPWRGACPETDRPFVVRLGALSLGVMDSSLADDREASDGDVARMVPLGCIKG